MNALMYSSKIKFVSDKYKEMVKLLKCVFFFFNISKLNSYKEENKQWRMQNPLVCSTYSVACYIKKYKAHFCIGTKAKFDFILKISFSSTGLRNKIQL